MRRSTLFFSRILSANARNDRADVAIEPNEIAGDDQQQETKTKHDATEPALEWGNAGGVAWIPAESHFI